MTTDYAAVSDVSALYRELTEEEVERAMKLIPVICARLRTEAGQAGMDLDERIREDEDLALTAKSVVVDIVARCLSVPTSGEAAAMSQISESALGYSISGTLANPGGGIFIKRTELSALGIRRQRWGVIDPYGLSD